MMCLSGVCTVQASKGEEAERNGLGLRQLILLRQVCCIEIRRVELGQSLRILQAVRKVGELYMELCRKIYCGSR